MASLTVREVREAFGATAVIRGIDIAIPDQILSGIEAAFGRNPVFARNALGSGYGVQPAGSMQNSTRRSLVWHAWSGSVGQSLRHSGAALLAFSKTQTREEAK